MDFLAETDYWRSGYSLIDLYATAQHVVNGEAEVKEELLIVIHQGLRDGTIVADQEKDPEQCFRNLTWKLEQLKEKLDARS